MRKIGIECESIEESQTWGVARIVNKLLEELASRPELASEFQFFLYFKSRVPDYPYLASPLFVKKIVRPPFIPVSFSLYYYLFLPIRLWFDRPAVLYFPNYMLPLIFAGRSLVILTEDIYSEMRNPQLPFRYRLAYGIFARWAARRATRLMAVSESSKRALTEVFGIARDRIVVNSLGVESRNLSTSGCPLVISGYLLYVGQAFPRRHLRETILAFQQIAPDFPDLKLIAIGKDKYNPPIIAGFLNERIIHHDYVSDSELAELYASARAIVYVSDREAFGLSPVEALAYGTPAIMADQPITREIFGNNAFFVNLSTSQDERLVVTIAAAMRDALTNELKRKQIKAAGAEIVARYTWASHTDRWLKIVSDIASQKANLLNWVFVVYLLLVGLVVVGVLPRAIVPLLAAAVLAYGVWAPLEETVLFFARSIPFFIAIPVTTGFDSLNLWRLLSIAVFLRWLSFEKIRNLFRPRSFTAYSLWLLALLTVLSLLIAPSFALALKRLIYFVNLSLIGIVVYDLASRQADFAGRLVKNIAIPTIIVIVVGFMQLASTYLMDIFQFVDWWGGTVQRNLYGDAWAEIALRANTWLAYFGERLSLRMFSTFPDSHSFPIFVLFGLAAVMAIALEKVIAHNIAYKTMLHTRGRIGLVFIPLGLLAVILSGTRGMWLAGGVTGLLTIACLIFFRKKLDPYRQAVFGYVSSYLIFFFLLFAVAYPIFGSAQFQVVKEDKGVFQKRVLSSFDLGETSNARRVEIWKASWTSIKKYPWLGVGIGNFPVVVGEDLALAKAGSSAHNLYIHIAAELGVPALITALAFLWILLVRLYRRFLAETDPLLLIYFAALLIFLPWNLLYSFTDVAIFDERAFLLFGLTVALILSGKNG